MPPREKSELQVFISSRDSTCGECHEALGRRSWITLCGEKGALCLACADLDHLVFLPAGDMALTRRARQHSTLCAVVLKWSRVRKRYERQGFLVEEAALDQAEEECLNDADARARRRERVAERRAELDGEYVARFAGRVRELYPHAPPGREHEIAEHACRKYSGRVGRSAGARALDPDAVYLAVAAHVRHSETTYDKLLAAGWARHDARDQVNGRVQEILHSWEGEAEHHPATGAG
ncbi:MAG: DUF2293 domain-containing protein [Acidobacteria bacterium]|nr:DUF2293 domain-containing protein [Acidobacteriota bacterium]